MTFKENDKSKAICQKCETIVNTTFKYRDISFKNNPDKVLNILVGVCDNCDSIVSTPAQSTATIHEAMLKS